MLHEHVALLHLDRIDDALGFLVLVNQDLSIPREIVAFDDNLSELLLQQRNLVRVALFLGLEIFRVFLLALS